jgi:hypothetical protein
MTSKDLLPAPRSADEALELANMLAGSSLIPKNFQNRPNDIVVSMMWSHSLGIPVLQGMQYIAVVNGRPSMYGDGLLAVCMNSGQMEDIDEKILDAEGENPTAICTIRRRGKPTPIIGTFSAKDAKKAGLWGKSGPWSSYPKRMLKMRARGFALRDAFPDVLSGMASAEEQEDIVEGTASEVERQPMPTARKMPRRKAAPAQKSVEQLPQDESGVLEPVAQPIAEPVADPEPVEQPQPEEVQAEKPAGFSDDAAIVDEALRIDNAADLKALWIRLTPEQKRVDAISQTIIARNKELEAAAKKAAEAGAK